jgi:hypothetical protein
MLRAAKGNHLSNVREITVMRNSAFTSGVLARKLLPWDRKISLELSCRRRVAPQDCRSDASFSPECFDAPSFRRGHDNDALL